MIAKLLKFLLITIISISCMVVGGLILPEKKMGAGSLKQDFLLKQSRYPLVIHGFKFSSYNKRGKNIFIKAVRFRIEKMKKGFLSSATIRLAKFKNAEIDLYVQKVESEKDLKRDYKKSNFSLKETFTREALPAYGFTNVASIIFEPVKINFYNGKKLMTQIQAKRASIKSKDGKIVFQGHVTAKSESKSLSTDKLILLSDIGEITTNRNFVFRTSENKITGKSITTDLSLNPISLIQNNYVDRRKYERKIHRRKNETGTLHSHHSPNNIIFVQANSD